LALERVSEEEVSMDIALTSILNYGVLGAWAVYLIYEKRTILKVLADHLADNTAALREIKTMLDFLSIGCKEKEEKLRVPEPPKKFL
jgi:hypothetical protein